MSETSTINPTARIAKNSLVQLVAGVLNKLLGVALVIYAARQLGTQGFGQYAFVLSMYAIFYILVDFGLGTLTTRDLACDPAQEKKYFGNLLLLRSLLALLAGLGMVGSVAALGHPPGVVALTAIAAASLLFNGNVDTCNAVLYAQQRMEVPASVSVIANTFRVTASLGALAAGAWVTTLLLVHTLSAALHFGLLLWIMRYYLQPALALDFAFWKRLLRTAFPLALANLFSVIYFRIDTIMLASMQGQSAVGVYNAAYRLLEFTMIVPAYYTGAIFPVISTSYQTHPQRFLLIYRRSFKYMWMVSLPMALGASVLAPQFINILYGQEYAASVPVLSVLMWSLVLIAANSINAPYLIAMGRQRIVTVLVLIGMLLNTGLNAWAIPRYGVVGAAWVTLISEMITISMFLGALSRPLALNLRMARHLVGPLCAGGFMVGLLGLIRAWDLGFQILLGGVVYLGLLLAFRTFDEVDMELFRRVLRPTSAGEMKIT